MISAPDAAAILGLSKKSVERWRTQPAPPIEPVALVGGTYVYDRSEVLDLARKRRAQMEANGGVMPRRPRGTLTRINP